MENNRIEDHPVLGSLKNQKSLSFTFDGIIYEGYEGDTIASALLANGIRKLRVQEETGTPRGIYCNIGHCYECRVTVDKQKGIRACMTEVQANMVIESGAKQPTPLKITKKDALPHTDAAFQHEEGEDRLV